MKKEKLPLIIDLDNSLITSDTLVDSISQCLSKNILNIFWLFFWIASGKAFLKYKLTQYFPIKAKELSFRKEVLDLINESKKKGKKIYLCSGSNEKQVKLIYEYLGLFDGYFGSNLENNLTGNKKKVFLEKEFGYKNFDYLGDSSVDIPIWKSSHKAYLVNVSKKVKYQLLRNKIDFDELIHSINFSSQLKNYLKVIRVYQWVKNLLIFVPIFLAQEFTENNFVNAIIAFICFSMVSSFVYVMNDFLDIQNDRQHPSKKDRPIALGVINPFPLMIIISIMLMVILSIASVFLDNLFLIILLFYILVNLFYSSFIKRLYFLDVLTLSSFYTLRLISGGVINDISLSPWLIFFSIFFFLYLALIKRIGEIINLAAEDKAVYGRSYEEDAIKRTKYITVFSSMFSLVLLMMYFFSDKALTLYDNIYILILICPLLIIWKIRLYKAATNNQMHDDPIIFIVKDKLSWIIFTLISLIIISQMRIW